MTKLGPYELNQIYTGDARELAKAIPDESVDLVFTDPPYPLEFIECYDVLAKLASHVLTKDGLCVTYSGNHHLPRVMSIMSGHLQYFWMGWLNHPAQHQRIWFKKIWCGGKPLLFYTRNGARPLGWITDTVTSRRDKRFHKWGQGANVAEYYINQLTRPGQIVLDPFTGGGTVPTVCKVLGRQWLAFEVDPDAAELARKRLRETQPPLFVSEPQQIELMGQFGG